MFYRIFIIFCRTSLYAIFLCCDAGRTPKICIILHLLSIFQYLGQILLLVDLRGKIRFRGRGVGGGGGKTNKKALEMIPQKTLKMTCWLIIFRIFVFKKISPEKHTVKLIFFSKVNQQSVSNLFKCFIIFLKIWTGQSLTVSPIKIRRENLKNIFIYFPKKQNI